VGIVPLLRDVPGPVPSSRNTRDRFQEVESHLDAYEFSGGKNRIANTVLRLGFVQDGSASFANSGSNPRALHSRAAGSRALLILPIIGVIDPQRAGN
jgi:hypothetical protein